MIAENPRLTIVVPSLAVGGTERQILYLLKALTDDYTVNVICTRERGALARTAERYTNVVSLGCRSGWDWRLRPRVARVLQRRPADIVHSFMFGFDYAVNAAARAQGVPVVIASRRQLATWKKPRHVRLQRRANRLVDCVVANSRAVADFAAEQESAAPDLFRVIPNAVPEYPPRSQPERNELRLEHGLQVGKRIVGIVANFTPVKDHSLLLKAARELVYRRADMHFVFFGDGPLRRSIEEQIAASGLANRVTIMSGESDASKIFGLMDVSVLCSHMEGSPNVIIEAMASRTPVVAAAVGGVPELIEDGETGLLVHSRRPTDFAAAIERMLENSDGETERMVGAAHDRVRTHHSESALAAAYRSVYDELLHGAARDREAA